ncbi:MAG: tetratricopeptide repeat protein [Silvanigrellaceae bacterium]|nr:tetratricopeptide repeat protein [Silvanigrellaceae bacterium]
MEDLLEISPDIGFLIVDDSQTMREAITQNLKTLGFHNTYQGSSVRSGIQTLRKFNIGFVICERNLKDTSGIEFLKEIREARDIAHVPFLMTASEIPKDDVFLAAEFGIDGYLKKPFVLKDMTGKIISALMNFKNPNNKEILFEKARLAIQKKDYQLSLSTYREILELLPESARARVGIGKCLKELKKFEEAETVFKDAIAKNNVYIHAYHELGHMKAEMKLYDEALGYFDKAIDLSPKNPLRYESVSELLMNQSRFSEAETYLRKAVKLELSYPELYSQLGKSLFSQKKLDKAFQYFEKALSEDPKNTSFLNSLAICKKEVGKFEEALRYYNLALKEVPNDPKILFNKALCYFQMKDYDKAEKLCKKILQIDPTYDKANQ